MYNTSFFKKILSIATIAIFYSCDKDFNAIGDDLIGDNHFDLESKDYSVTAYNQKVTPVAANNLPVNALGIYDNPVFGETIANFNTQVTLDSYAPTFGQGVVIDSVTLHIPYFSHVDPKQTSTDGSTAFILDSIYGPSNGIIKLSVYESGIFLNSYNPNNYDTTKFYNTDKNSDFLTQATTNPSVFGERLNNSTNEAENEKFIFRSKQIKEKTPATATTAESVKWINPEMRLHLNKEFFKTKIFDAPANRLASAEVFKNYFKGLYFNVEKSGTLPSRMAIMNFRGGKINIFYKSIKPSTANPPVIEMESKTLVINLGNTTNTTSVNTVNLLEESDLNPDYVTATANDVTPDERLYLKGGQGSMAVIELFDKTDLGKYDDKGKWQTTPNSVPDELDEIRNKSKEWLANEANLVFTVDSQKMGDAKQPGRIFLYDLENNTVLADYTADRTSSLNGDPKKNKTVFNGLININSTTKAVTYKIRITNHIRNMIKNADVANVKLGLVVTEDINIINSSRLDQTKINKNSAIAAIPTASVMNSLGTVLFGSNIPESDMDNYPKRVKLQIYYTKLKPN